MRKALDVLAYCLMLAAFGAAIAVCVLYPAVPLYAIAYFEWGLPILGVIALAWAAVAWFFEFGD